MITTTDLNDNDDPPVYGCEVPDPDRRYHRKAMDFVNIVLIQVNHMCVSLIFFYYNTTAHYALTTTTGVHMSFSKSDIESILNSPSQVSRAIEIIGNNQRDDELASRSTNTQNGIGFQSCWASTGTHLWQFVTGWDARTQTNRWGRKCLSHQNWRRARYIKNAVYRNDCFSAVELGRKIAITHWRQLGELLPEQKILPPQNPAKPTETVKEPEIEVEYEGIMVPVHLVPTAIAILKAAKII